MTASDTVRRSQPMNHQSQAPVPCAQCQEIKRLSEQVQGLQAEILALKSRPQGTSKESQRARARSRVPDKEKKRATQACKNCQKLKQKCDGQNPCNNCRKRGHCCVFGSPRRTPGPRPRYGSVTAPGVPDRPDVPISGFSSASFLGEITSPTEEGGLKKKMSQQLPAISATAASMCTDSAYGRFDGHCGPTAAANNPASMGAAGIAEQDPWSITPRSYSPESCLRDTGYDGLRMQQNGYKGDARENIQDYTAFPGTPLYATHFTSS